MAMIPEAVLQWAAQAAAGGAGVASVRGLRLGGSPWLLRFVNGDAAVLRVAADDDPAARIDMRVEAAALDVAETLRIPTARLIALDLFGSETGAPAMLMTVVEGSSRIPAVAGAERLRAMGAACATLLRTPAPPFALERLPLRSRPIETVDFAAVRRARAVTGLAVEAEQALAAVPVPDEEHVFVHGDFWQGNTMWVGDRISALVDWDCAGIGPHGVDLGSARCDAAVLFGTDAADELLRGWEDAAGQPAENVAYWDVVAALSTPPDMAEFVPTIQGQGRPDLERPLLAERRDAFLQDALNRLA